jgi:hypothetical protein
MQLRTLLTTLAFIAVCSLPIACSSGGAEASNRNNAATSDSTASTAEQVPALSATPLKVPANFTAYAAQSIGRNMLCHVGAVTGDDGMNQKPVAYAQDAKDKKILWVKQLELPSDTFQSRATHCTGPGASVFVLLQSDTQSEQTLSQTLLRVVKLNADTGAVIAQQNVDVPKAYSAWVDEGAPHFQWLGNALVIAGNYRSSSDNANSTPFTVHLNSDLKQ